MALLLPNIAGASWPFSVTHASGAPSPIISDSSLNLLSAPISANVDDNLSNSPITSDGSALVGGVDLDGPAIPTDINNATDTVVAPTSTNGAISTYTVKAGDTLSQIAQNYGVTENTILWANNITDKSTIKPGDTLVILPVSGIQHTVRVGETLSSIATKYGGNAADIALFNGLPARSALQSGSTIIIPGGELNSTTLTKISSAPTKKTTTTTTTTKSGSSTHTSVTTTNSSGENSSVECDNTSGNPCHGISGTPLRSFFTNPLPGGALVSQGLHGWDAVDLATHAGTSIDAAASGTVILSSGEGGWNGGYGNYVILDNGQGVETLYSHMTQTKATVGETVSAGEVIGYVGMTGDATGDHLHFEVRGAQSPFAFCTEGMNSNSCFNP